MRPSNAAWWMVEVGMPFLGVVSGVGFLFLAVVLSVLGVDETLERQLFVGGLALWIGGIGWGMFVNGRGPVRRWLTAR